LDPRGNVQERFKIAVRTWVFVLFEMAASKNGVSAREVARKYEITEEAAWFMCHRIREAMKRDPFAGLLRGTIVADETYMGGKISNRHARNRSTIGVYDKTPVISLVHKETGEVRSRVVANVTGSTLRSAIRDNIDVPGSTLHTD